jgi:5-methylcytosine-specific restriction protein A
MKTYLLTWNPKYWKWENIEEDINNLKKIGFIKTEWDCSSKMPEEGDVFFIIAVGKSKKKGIFCSGVVNDLMVNMPSLISNKKVTNRIIGNINLLLNPDIDEILDLNYLNKKYPEQKWSPQNCGITIKEKYTNSLINSWEELIGKNKSYNTKLINKEFWEGSIQEKLFTSFERNINARNECIKINGHVCKICGINLEDMYGEIGKNFIHVHHITFHSSIKKKHKIDPENDLITVCPNCHSMLHRKIRGEYLTVEELKNKILKQP